MSWIATLLETVGQIFVQARLNKFTGLFGIWGKDPVHPIPAWEVKKRKPKIKKKSKKKPS